MTAGAELPERADVVVVGGGIVGTSTAYFLTSRTDRDVLLVEKDRIAGGSTGDSSAILRHHYGADETYARMAKWSHEFYREFEERTGERIAYAPNPLVRLGQRGEASAAHAEAGCEILRDLDLPVSRQEGAEITETYPMLSPGEADVGVTDESAAYSDGADAAGGFARAAESEGATVVTGVEVENVHAADGAVTGVATTEGRVDADAVVLAVGPWTPEFVAPLGVDVPIRRRREKVLILEPDGEYLDDYPDIVPTTSPPGADWYIRSDFSDGVLVATHHTGEPADPDTYSDTPEEDVMLEMIDRVGEFVPELADARLRGRYCGIYSDTPDRDFVIDRAGPDGCYLACGFSGHGFKHGPIVGRILSDLVVEGETDLVDTSKFSLDRFGDDPWGADEGRQLRTD